MEVLLVDSAGIVAPDSDRAISFRIDGPGELIGVDNGDLRSNESYKGASRTSRFGRCLAIIQSGRKPGTVRFTAFSDGLPQAGIEITTG